MSVFFYISFALVLALSIQNGKIPLSWNKIQKKKQRCEKTALEKIDIAVAVCATTTAAATERKKKAINENKRKKKQ